jgi:hypothetical protein
MLLLEFDTGGVLAVEFEGDAPRPIYVDRIARWTADGIKKRCIRIHFRPQELPINRSIPNGAALSCT